MSEKLILLVAALAVLSAGCTQPTAGGGIAPFTLKAGQSELVQDAGINVTFVGISADSRCPTGVTCIRAGEAKVWIKAAKIPSARGTIYSSEFEMARGAGLPIDEKNLSDIDGRYALRLLEVNPYPAAGSPIPDNDYSVTLELRRIS